MEYSVSFIRAHIIVMEAVNSMLVNQPYTYKCMYIFFSLLLLLFFFLLFRATPGHMEVPRLGVKSEL